MSVPQPGAFASVRLDDPVLVESGDPGGLLRQTAAAAAQVRMSLRAAQEADLAPSRPRTILVAASGASAWAGELLVALCGPQSPVQIQVVRGHQLPGWVGAPDLMIGVSASGTRTETLALAREAVRRGCEFVGVGPARTPLADLATQARGTFVAVPPGPGRSMLWGLSVPLLETASRLGILQLTTADYEAAAAALEEISHQCRPSSESFVNPAKSLALDIAGTLPVVWGGSPLAAMAAARFGSLLALNGKYPAVAGSFPDVAYDQVAILDGPFAPAPTPMFPPAEDFASELSLDDLPFDDPAFEDDEPEQRTEPRLVLLADEGGEHPAVTRMRAGTLQLAAERGLLLSELVMDAEVPSLRRLAGIVQLLDYTSVYLGIACGLDPLSSAGREELREFAERPEGPQA